MVNTAAHAEQWFREFEVRAGERFQGFELGAAVEQMRLFMEDLAG